MSKKAKGFGQSPTPTRKFKDFLLAFGDFYRKNSKDETKLQQFLKANINKLDDLLLDALPLVFTSLIADKSIDEREKIASLLENFAVTIYNFPLGDRATNLELSITAHNLSLKIYTREDSPEDWAGTLNNLAVACKNRILGDRAENLERAIKLYEQALEVRTRKNFPVDWAGTLNNLALAYSDRIRGDRADNLEKAIELYGQALEIYTRKNFLEDWAMTLNNLANAYSDRIRGDRAENLEKAIELYGQALEIYTRKNFPVDWAGTLNNLALAYSDRIRGDRAENLEKAIELYGQALEVRTRKNFPENWAMTLNNLANAYSVQILGDRAENLEKAIELYEQALEVYTRENFPVDWAISQHNLASAYRERVLGERKDNLEQAIHLHNQAAQIFTRAAFPVQWAGNQGHLAEALMQRDNPGDLDTAIALLQEALEVSPAGCQDFIDSQYRLGIALSQRYDRDKNFDDLRQALVAYKTALDLISPEHYDRKDIWKALPTTQTILGSRLVRDGEWQQGLQLLLNSVNQLSTSDDRLAHANALCHTGRAYEVLSDREKARLYYRDALRWYEYLQDLPGIAKSRTGLGNVFVSQGYLEKGMKELDRAKAIYRQLPQTDPDRVEEIDIIYQASRRAIERQTSEVYL
ncbi:MAG: tetratricopeptide repeat protein [Microcystis aeruginosa Ma_QC_Ch_20071001_S25]|uniref:Tetratricopeptide repeat protein n=1 Tax=Microcystis aeruginosa Ma_QC_Ch_20071001_S25D TaxID=2486250 RepID=A0A552G7C4_MICAE|nr:MAG: tetratricopeptide repeat protein [Microcystis aeruginosa Ma_QC_Ch_20071001_S25]TRU54870.1 MAG: tetratricopeptide repeat protein [Microcystis aeruginosa Ma_QC_Ch_20071001_S25D]TRU67724.1 MAG: tetratricopeptide repeat protein [Microcystis aeruginosa Ma_QC_Ch_20071001_M135]